MRLKRQALKNMSNPAVTATLLTVTTKTIKPAQIHCQVIIYMEASISEADPPFSDFTTPQIGRGQVLLERKAAAPLRSVMGKPLLAFWLCLALDNKVIAMKICVKFLEAFSVQVAAAEWY